MFCPKCEFYIRDPMAIECEQCGYDLTKHNLEFLHKFEEWLSECIDDGDISKFKARFLLHLASKYVRGVQVIDGWAKSPCNVNVHIDDKFINVSAGEVQQVGESDIYVSLLEQAWEVFPLREFMDDPYVRIIIRNDVPIVKANAVLETIIELLTKGEKTSHE